MTKLTISDIIVNFVDRIYDNYVLDTLNREN